jgi:hypothetical protein
MCTQITRMDIGVIEGYYHMTTMDEHVNEMKLSHIFSKQISKTQGDPFVHLPSNSPSKWTH